MVPPSPRLARCCLCCYALPRHHRRRAAAAAARVWGINFPCARSLARFATEKYDLSAKGIKNRFCHLTNYSVNKKSTKFDVNVDATEDGAGSKWSLKALLRRLAADGVDTAAVMDSIRDIIVKTIISAESEVSSLCNRLFRNRSGAHAPPCVELFGFDILLDAKLKCWLIEVNVSPSLSSSSPLDKTIKNMLLTDVFHAAGIAACVRARWARLCALPELRCPPPPPPPPPSEQVLPEAVRGERRAHED